MTYPSPYDYRTPAEKLDDLMFDAHEAGICHDECRFCDPEYQGILKWVDENLHNPKNLKEK